MDAKEKQSQIIKSCLKPLFKQFGFRNKRQTWWKEKGDFIILINLRNLYRHEMEKVNFTFDIGIILSAFRFDQDREPTSKDFDIRVDEDFFMHNDRKQHAFRFTNPEHDLHKTGYVISGQTDIVSFSKELSIDFLNFILPVLDDLNVLVDCVKLFGEIPDHGDFFKGLVMEAVNNKNIK